MQTVETTNVTRVCGKCGSKLFADAPQGLCSLCLFKAGLGLLTQDDESLGSRPACTPTEFGDYELLEEIGRGGQGVVYRAHQKSLNRTVALKVIGLGHWATEAHLKRFRREAEAAASLEHPGIVPIHEVGERDGQCYFSMKFIEGGQLDEVVRREPMPIRQAAQVVAKVARTVHYAHQHGILHRDIKPGNILLDTNREPHLTDFGLARLVEAESTITRTREVLGTPSYMAPEQAAGKNAQLTSATDVYGLGAVLYQLLTGHPPFAGGTTYETIKLLLETEPRPPRVLNPKIDRDLSTICLKCLEKDAKRRYSSALALADDLEHWLKHEPIRAHRTGIFARGRKWVRRKPAVVAVITLSLALAAAVAWNVWKSEVMRHPVTSGVAVLPFENLSKDPDNAYLAEGIQDEIITRLAGIAGLRVISRSSTQHYQNKPGNLAEIAKQLGVANILEGSVQKTVDQVRVNVQLINAQTDSHLWADTYDRTSTDVLGIESEIAKRIAESLQAKVTGREEQALAVKPTNNPEAYDAYLHGLSLDTRGLTGTTEGNSIASYERAVRLDPNFATAWARLSHSNALRYYSSNGSTDRDAAKRALEEAQKLAPDSSETLLALGYYQCLVLLDYGAAKTTFGRVSELLPSSSEAPRALGLVSRHAGLWDESVSYYERALTLDPRNVELLTAAAQNYELLRQFPAALKLCDRVLDIAPNDGGGIATKVVIYQAQGNLKEAATLLSGENLLEFSSLFNNQLRLERNYGEAIRLLQALVDQFHSDSQEDKASLQLDLALEQRLAGDTTGAKVNAEQARNTLESLYRNNPNDLFLTKQLSWAYALVGEKDLALKLAERAVMLRPRAKDVALGPTLEENLAGIQTIVGENSRAILILTQLLQMPYSGGGLGFYLGAPITTALLRLDPVWDPLRTEPAFQELCEEQQK